MTPAKQPHTETTRLFVRGQLVEMWEDARIAFGQTPGHLRHYAERGAWGLLFNALALGAPEPESERGS